MPKKPKADPKDTVTVAPGVRVAVETTGPPWRAWAEVHRLGDGRDHWALLFPMFVSRDRKRAVSRANRRALEVDPKDLDHVRLDSQLPVVKIDPK